MINQISEYFKIALRNLKTRSLRSWLTIFGILIGVFLIISLLSLSEGLKDTIGKQLQALGGEMIMVMPGDSDDLMGMMLGGGKLERQDVEAIKKSRGVGDILPYSYSGSVARYKEESNSVFLAGMPWDPGIEMLQVFQGWSLAEGRWPSPNRREVLAGSQLKKDIFEEKLKVGEEIIIKGRKFEVAGILNSLGSKTDDSFIYLDLDTYQSLTGDEKGSAQMVMAKVEEGFSVDDVAKNIEESLEKTRKRVIGSDESNFSVITPEKINEIAGGILSVIQLAIILFAGIAIVVGGIGITNTMFTSVRERTKEIGVMKAIGAKNSAILTIFLFESGIIGLTGGTGGVILGVSLAKIIENYFQVHPVIYFTTSVSPGLVIFGLGFSFVIGCLAGALPARSASKMRPVDALRYSE
jgi:putative ABC transport system permease protein